jgi:hypothetical protein
LESGDSTSELLPIAGLIDLHGFRGRFSARRSGKGATMSRAARAVLSHLSVAVALVLLASPECALADDADSAEASGDRVLEDIVSTWKARANSIQTLRIRARFFRRGSDLRPLTPDSEIRVSDGRLDVLAERDHRQVSLYREGESPYGRFSLMEDGMVTKTRSC